MKVSDNLRPCLPVHIIKGALYNQLIILIYAQIGLSLMDIRCLSVLFKYVMDIRCFLCYTCVCVWILIYVVY